MLPPRSLRIYSELDSRARDKSVTAGTSAEIHQVYKEIRETITYLAEDKQVIKGMRHLARLAPVGQLRADSLVEQCPLETTGAHLGLDGSVDPGTISASCHTHSQRSLIRWREREETLPVPDSRNSRHKVRLDQLRIIQ